MDSAEPSTKVVDEGGRRRTGGGGGESRLGDATKRRGEILNGVREGEGID